jgi:predicted ATPase/DNA-binding SARP family transcriptional activator
MRLGLLGPLELDGEPSRDLAPRVENVLIVLGLRPDRAVSADAIEAFLWGEQPPATARKSVQVAVSELRRQLGHDAIGTTEHGYVLRDVNVDVTDFELGCRRGRELLNDGQPWAAADVLEAALSLWRGAPLGSLIDHAEGQSVADALEEQRRSAEEDLADAQLACGKHRDIVGVLRTAVDAAPFRERRWSQLMLALYRCGRKVEALEAYQEVAKRLGEDLGVEPGPEVIALEEAILLNKPDLNWRPDDTSMGTAVVREHRIVGHRFIGRRSELAALRSALDGHQLVTIAGPGGVGKTRLALQVAAAAPERRDGMLFVDLSSADGHPAVVETWVRAAGIAEHRDEDRETSLLEAYRNLDQLVVLDNCEHVLAACSRLLGAMLPQAPGVQIVATSREAIGTEGELVVVLEPLGLAREEPLTPDDALRSEAVALLFDRWDARDPNATLDERTAPLLCTLAERVDGLPLALELVAARLPVVSLEDLDRRLGTDPRILDRATPSARSHQDTLRAAIGWSFDLLDEPERRALSRISVFVDGCHLDEAEEVLTFHGDDATMDVLGCLESLVAKSLVQFAQGGTEGRYRLLELVRTFADDVVDPEERERLVLHHALTYQELAVRLGPMLADFRQPYATARITREIGNFRRAIARLNGDPEHPFAALRLVEALLVYFEGTGLTEEYREWIDSTWDDAAPPQLRAFADMYRSGRQLEAGDHVGALAIADEGVALARSLGHEGLLAVLLTARALALFGAGRDDEALAEMDHAIETARRATASGRELTLAMQMRARTLYTSNPARAREIAEDALDLARIGGPTGAISGILIDISMFDFEEGRTGDALVHMAEANHYASQIPNESQLAGLRLGEGLARYRLGEFDAAEAILLDGLRFYIRVRIPQFVLYTAMYLGLIYVMSDPLRAARCLGICQGIQDQLASNRMGHRELDELAAATEAARHKCGDAAFADAFAGGHALDYNDAIAYLLGGQRFPGVTANSAAY